MRNLKKFLALVLAMMMTLSLMVTVNAATDSDFTDKDSITENFAEGIEVLKGMGVFEGYPDGSFGPKGEITRAETAAIVYRLATGDWEGTQAHLYKDYQQFDDVASSQWFAGYINYCANAEWIAGYGNGKFGPNDKVTAYQAAAMILRAVGYGKNGEFVGSTWRTQVANVTRSEGLLVNVDKTTYANTMNNFATRELVAEILFQAAQIPTVTWSMLGGYNKYQASVTVAGQDNLLNPSLGYINYGLTNHQGIVLGNQATGEKATKIGFGINQLAAATDPQVMNNSGSYTYTDTAATTAAAGNVTMAFDAETGLDLFGHKVKVWYNANGGTHKTYAVFDKAVLSATITASAAEKIGKTQLDADAGANKLSAAVNAAGFTVPVTDQQFYTSESFSRFGALADTAPTATTAKVYVVISNNSDKTVDVVIPVNVAAAQITKVDNWSATKTISLDATLSGTFAIDVAAGEVYEQDDVTSPSEGFVVGSKVIATEITKSTADDTNPVYWLDNVPASSVTGKVVHYDTTTKTVTLEGGKTLDSTIIDNAAISNGTGNYNVKSTSSFKYTTYKFTLDGMGNWLHAEEVFENNFVYGTYIDYSTNLGTGTFTYQLVGVDLNGEVVKYNPTKFQLQGDASATALSGAKDIGTIGIPYHEHGASASTGGGLVGRDGTVVYKGFIMKDTLMDNQDATLKDIAGIVGLSTNGKTVINKSGVDMGVVQVTNGTADGTAGKEYVYLTEKTKFIVVDGYGTDTLKPVVYNGISALLGGSGGVSIDHTKASEILCTMSNYMYSNTGVISKQVDTIILPKDALEYDGGNNLYFFHKVTSSVASAGDDAYLFEGYQNGEKVNVWVDVANVKVAAGVGTICVANNTTELAADKFLLLVDSGKKAANGEPVYTTKAVDATAGTGQNVAPGTSPNAICYDTATAYKADTMNTQTALLDTTLVKVADAKVVNLVPNLATIKSLDDLNHLSSVVGDEVTVAVTYAETGSKTISVIYVLNVAHT